MNPLIIKIKNWLNNILASRDARLVLKNDGNPLIARGHQIDYHDFHHLEVSQLERIKIGDHWVSGIHGLNMSVYHDNPINPEYRGSLDEVRVAVHEWMTEPSMGRTIKILVWIGWLMWNNINPISVIIQHYQSLKNQTKNTMPADDMVFDEVNEVKRS